jgi:hypothetical protein
VIVIPAFAVGRAQALMLHIARLRERQEIPRVPVYLNSPMAINATRHYHAHHSEHHVSDEDCERMFDVATFVNTVAESKALNRQRGPMIIISASGMITGGRVLHHIEAFGPDERNAILLAGYQAGGTRGAALAAGKRTLRMFGREVPIRAEVVQLEGFSGHADAGELLDWMRTAPSAPRIVYLTHGEPDAADTLRGRVQRELGWRARVPEHLEQRGPGGCAVTTPAPGHTRLRVTRAGIDTYQQPVVYMHRDCEVCRSEGFAAMTRVRLDVGTRTLGGDAERGGRRSARPGRGGAVGGRVGAARSHARCPGPGAARGTRGVGRRAPRQGVRGAAGRRAVPRPGAGRDGKQVVRPGACRFRHSQRG